MQAVQIANFVFSTRSTSSHTAKPFGFYSGNELDIGRDLVQKLLNIEDNCISKHHIRISSVEFDELQSDETDAVNPLVYMQVLSKNGLTIYNSCAKPVQPHKLCQGTSRLLNHGDVLILSPSIIIMVTLRINCDRDGFTPTDMKTQTFGHYRLTSRIIRTGGFARVVLASNIQTGQQLACKIISGVRLSLAADTNLPTHEQDNASRYLKLRIRREIDIASHLDHPHIVKVHETFQYQQRIYIFQDLATGGDLTSYLTQYGPLDQAEVILIAYQLAHAVRYLHQRGIAHRDLKPENILRSSSQRNSRIMLADFGQARQLSMTVDNLTGEHVARMESQVGTYGWQAPLVFLQSCLDSC
ncbi:hypothetical protein MRB53_041216 [Persea americana]|nr:hypothetical protein MRB53_041216 [Persea americana]